MNKRSWLLLLFPVLLWAPGRAEAIKAHQEIRAEPASRTEANLVCVGCHQNQEQEVRQSVHWRLQRQRMVNGKNQSFGIGDDLSLFGISATANPDTCLRCHIRISGPDRTRPQVDCLICHDTTGRYGLRGPISGLTAIVREAGRPGPGNCRRCHGRQCGLVPGNPVTSDHDDVHMARFGFTCQRCHPAAAHTIARSPVPGGEPGGRGCDGCHPRSPHNTALLNLHGGRLGCGACHTPVLARTTPTVISWNWLLSDSRLLRHQDKSIGAGKGFFLGRSLRPLLLWDDGGDQVYTRGTRISPGQTVVLQGPSPRTPRSRLQPFAAIHGTQLMDAKYHYLLSPALTSRPDSRFLELRQGAEALRQGMINIRLPFSGQTRVVTTVQYRRVNHATAPANQALTCLDCHGPSAGLDWQGLGYDHNPWPKNPVMSRPDPPEQATGPVDGTPLPPVRETVLPAVPSL